MPPTPNAHTPPPAFVDGTKPSHKDPTTSPELPQKPKWKAYAVVLALIAIVLALVGSMAVLSAREGNARGYDPTPGVE